MNSGGTSGKGARSHHVRRAVITLTFALLVLPASLGAQTFKSLAQARQAAASAKTQDALRAALFAAMPQLSIRDSISLAREFEPKAGAALKAELRGTIGGLYLLAGQSAEAASWYAKAAELDAKYRPEAARIALAVGDGEAAGKLAAAESLPPAAKTALELWGLLLEGKYAAASSRASEALAASPGGPERSELLFLKYVADFGQFGSAQPALIREFPASMGADLISGKVFPAPSFLLSLGLSWLGPAAPLKDYRGASASPLKDERGSTSASGSSAASPWLQVGYFSLKENAERLSKSLAAKHFESRVVEMKNKDGEMRWLVQVAAKDDWQSTQSALKDLGYESYLAAP